MILEFQNLQNSIIMNELDKLFSEGLDDFQEEIPSKAVKRRILATLLSSKYLKLLPILIFPIVAALGYYSIGLFAGKPLHNSNLIVNNESKSQPIITETTTNKLPNDNYRTQTETVLNVVKEKGEKASRTYPEKVGRIEPGEGIKMVKERNKVGITQQPATNKLDSISLEQVNATTETKTTFSNHSIDLPAKQIEEYRKTEVNRLNESDFRKFALLNFGGFVLNETNNLKPIIVKRISSLSKYLEVYCAATSPNKILISNDLNSIEYINLRNSSEDERFGADLGFNLRIQKNQWFTTFGAKYTQVTEDENYSLPFNVINKTTYNYSIVSISSTLDTIGSMPDPNNQNNLVPVLGIVSQSDTTNFSETYSDTVMKMENYKLVQRYQFFSVPITVGYEFRAGRFGLEISGGVAYSRLIAHTSNLVNFELDGILNEETTRATLVKHNVYGLAGFGATWWFTEDKALFFRPELRYDINSMFVKETAVKQRYASYNLVLGLRYEL